MTTRVGIINVTGFAGMETARILARHPEAEVVAVTGRSLAGQRLGEAFPHLAPRYPDLTITERIEDSVDVVFSAMPTSESAAACAPYIEGGVAVIDIAADFRLRDPAAFQHWFGKPHPAPDVLDRAVYGLPELHPGAIRESKLIANPGCYPTAGILALAPAVAGGFVTGPVVVDAKSGISGAGRGSGGGFNYSLVNEDVSAYKIEGHNHQPEIVQELSTISGTDVSGTFVPHLIPMTRGILATCYAPLARDVSVDEIRAHYRDFYAGAPFTAVSDAPVHTKHTLGSNMCLVNVTRQGDTLVACAAIDNLVKGAAGQAIENMNLVCGYPQTMALDELAVWP
jgi:N-acetyl-gamma-glutamyl-phosphate reductase